MRMTIWSMVTLGLAVLACMVPSGEENPAVVNADVQDAVRRPIVFVHGCPPPFANSDIGSRMSDRMRDFFRARGYGDALLHRFVFDGPNCASNVEHAKQIARFVERVRVATGAETVDIVAHSMGALAARLFISQGGHRDVRDVVSIGGGNHGSGSAVQWQAWQAQLGYPAYEGMREMYPAFACEGATAGGGADIQFMVNGCLTRDGRTVHRDETPGAHVDYLSIWNTIDEVVIPPRASCLNQRFQNDCADSVNVAVTVPPSPGPCAPDGSRALCPGHLVMLWNRDVLQLTYDFVTGRRGGHSHP